MDAIFDLTREDWKYKGILFAEVDFTANEYPMPVPKDFNAYVVSVIFVDENGIWNIITRVKFSSGSKHVYKRKYGNVQDEIKINETYILNELYETGLKNKFWFKNHSETAEGIVYILQQQGMIEKVITQEREQE